MVVGKLNFKSFSHKNNNKLEKYYEFQVYTYFDKPDIVN